jgi:ribonuclease H-related protein
MNYYAVKAGRTIGIFDNYPDCQKSINGFSNPVFKGFKTKAEAEAYLNDIDLYEQQVKRDIDDGFVIAYCDGSFREELNRYSYGVLIIDKDFNEHEIFGSAKNEKFLSSKNIIGEIFGVINSLDWAVSNGAEKIKIYHDYDGISKWISGEWEAKSDAAKMFIGLYNAKFADLLTVEFVWIPGHSHNKYNERADELAERAFNNRVREPIKGDHWFTINQFKEQELMSIIELIHEALPEITEEQSDSANWNRYRFTYYRSKLTVTLFKSGKRKLLVQGMPSIIFQIFTTYCYELLGVDSADKIMGEAYRTNIDSQKITASCNELCLNFPPDYPENIKKLVRQSIINLEYYVTSEDYSQYAFPALRALEGHMKYMFSKIGINIISKHGFNMFNKDDTSGLFVLPQSVGISNNDIKVKLEKYYNVYHQERHTILHYGDILGETDSTRIIEKKSEADDIIKKCINIICND